jgi:hypothetical protein
VPLALDEIMRVKTALEGDGSTRHDDYDSLVDATHGNYYDHIINATWKKWQGIIYETTKDRGAERNKVKVTVNLLNPIVEAKRSLWSVLPQIRCPYRDLSPEALTASDRLEKVYRYLWRENRMSELLGDGGWYNALLGTTIFGVWPDMINHRPQFVVRSPYGFYGVPGNISQDGTEWKSVFFVTRLLGRQAKAMWPDKKLAVGDSTTCNVVEYWDTEQKLTYLQETTEILDGPVTNKLGFVPVVAVPNIAQPGTWAGKSDIIDAIPIVNELNKRFNIENQALSDMAGAPWVAINPDVGPEELSLDPDAINPMGAGGDLKKATGNQLPYQIFQSDAVLRQYIDMVTDFPEVMRSMFGGSIATGKGIQALQGPIQARMELRQRYLFPRLEVLNKMALKMWASYWPSEPIVVYGTEKGKNLNLEVDIKEFEGFYENEVYLDSSSYFDVQSRAIVGLQMVQNELLSAKTFVQKLNPFVDDGEAEIEQIRAERMERIQTAMASQMMLQSPQGQWPGMGGPPIEQRQLSAGTVGAPNEPIPGPPGVSEGMLEEGATSALGGPWGGINPELPGAAGGGLLERLADAIRNVPNTRGRIFLTGSILEGELGPEGVEIWFTEMLDWATVRQAVSKQIPEVKGKFTPYQGEPNVPYLEVTPGSTGYEVSGPGTGMPEEGSLMGEGASPFAPSEAMGAGVPAGMGMAGMEGMI